MKNVIKPPHPNRLVYALLILVAAPLLGIFMGGVYSIPAMKLTKERDPGLSLLLSMGLAASVFGIGYFSHAPLAHLAGVWSVSLLLLIVARQAFGSLGHSVERFGVVHAMTLQLTVVICVAAHLRTRIK